MLRKSIVLPLSFLMVLYSPWWWLTLVFLVFAVILIERFYLIILPALLFDFLYGSGVGGLAFLGLLTVVIALPIASGLKKSFRFI